MKRRGKGKRLYYAKRGIPRSGDPYHAILGNRISVGLPYHALVHLKAYSRWHANTATGFYCWQWRGNSVYDPDATIGGNRAIGFNQITYVYQYYKVISSRIKVSFQNHDATIPLTVVVVPTVDANTIAIANYAHAPGQPYAKTGYSTSEKSGVVSHAMSTKAVYNVRDLDSPNYTAANTANPANQWYWDIYLIGHADGATALNADVQVEIDYYVECTQPWAHED